MSRSLTNTTDPWILMQDVGPDCPPLKTAAEIEDDDSAVTLRLSTEQVTAIRDALRDDLIEDWCSECGKERSPGGPDDDLRPQDHDPACVCGQEALF